MLRLPSLVAAALAALLVPPVVGCSGATPDGGARLAGEAPPAGPAVVAISIDGLSVEAVRQLGAAGTPTIHRLLDEGASTLNARTEVEQTITLPNHTSMVTGRRIDRSRGGHGVTWNDDRAGTTVQRAAGRSVGSVFSRVHGAGGTTALYTTKSKFSLFPRSWPNGVDTFRVKENQRRLVRLAKLDLADDPATFTFLHVSLPDRFGHDFGGMSPQYLDAVRRTDAQLAGVVRAVADQDVVVLLTSDHGFATGETEHSERRNPENYRVLFATWGAGVERGDLYEMNPDFRDPGAGRPSYAGRQPVRNGNVANLALSLLGLASIPGSGIDPDQELVVN